MRNEQDIGRRSRWSTVDVQLGVDRVEHLDGDSEAADVDETVLGDVLAAHRRLGAAHHENASASP